MASCIPQGNRGRSLVAALLLVAAACSGGSSSGEGGTTTTANGSFYGDWFRHATSAHFSSDGTGTYATHAGFTSDGHAIEEVLQLALVRSPDGRTLEARVTEVAYVTYDDDGNPHPTEDPEPERGSAEGDVVAYRFAAPHFLEGSGVDVEDPSGRSEYLCSNDTAPADKERCGA